MWEVRGVRVWATHSRGALVDGSVARGADLELGELVVVDLDRVSRVAVASSDTLPSLRTYNIRLYRGDTASHTHLCHSLRIGVEVKQPPRELGRCCVVIGLHEHADGTAQGDLPMHGLKFAIREVRCELQASADVIWVLLRDSTALKLERDT